MMGRWGSTSPWPSCRARGSGRGLSRVVGRPAEGGCCLAPGTHPHRSLRRAAGTAVPRLAAPGAAKVLKNCAHLFQHKHLGLQLQVEGLAAKARLHQRPHVVVERLALRPCERGTRCMAVRVTPARQRKARRSGAAQRRQQACCQKTASLVQPGPRRRRGGQQHVSAKGCA